MLDIGWTELMVIGLLALIVVGPKELPRLLRTVGQFVGKARGMAREFQRSMEDAAREADLKELTDLKRDIDKMGRVDFKEQARRSSASLTGPSKAKTGTGAGEAGAAAEDTAEDAAVATKPAKANGSAKEAAAASKKAPAEKAPAAKAGGADEPAATPPESKAAPGEP